MLSLFSENTKIYIYFLALSLAMTPHAGRKVRSSFPALEPQLGEELGGFSCNYPSKSSFSQYLGCLKCGVTALYSER